MIFTPPFYLAGEAGKALDATPRSLEALKADSATLKLRSLDADELSFTLRARDGVPVPDDEQMLTLTDGMGQRLITGPCARSFRYPARVYQFTVKGVYQGLLETPLVTGDRAYVLFPQSDLAASILNLLGRARNAGLDIQPPATMPSLYLIPKMDFRATSHGLAIEDFLKWAPDVSSRVDYSTEPPTLRFYSRQEQAPLNYDLESDSNKLTEIILTPKPEARALAVAMAYARRDGDTTIQYLVQKAGDDTAEARRKISIYLSGQERSDLLVTEALTTAQKAVAVAQAAVDAVGASVTLAAASAQIAITWANLLSRDTNLQAAVTAQSGFTMSPASTSITLFTGIGCGSGSPITTTVTYSGIGPSLVTSGGSPATGWYPIVTGAFTAPQLATAGATKETRYIRGRIYANISGGSAGFFSLPSGLRNNISGYSQSYTSNCANTSSYFEQHGWYYVDIAVDAINMSPAAVAAAVSAAANSASSSFITRAEFVEAPDNLAQNYFDRQDWTPYQGTLNVPPSAVDKPMPGEFINVLGDDVPTEWATMKTPVSELSLDLKTMAATVSVGPPPRQDFSSLVDRLRIPQEDNYQAG